MMCLNLQLLAVGKRRIQQRRLKGAASEVGGNTRIWIAEAE